MAKPGKRLAKTKLTITKRAVDLLKPADTPWIAWDDKLTGFGVRVHPTGAKSFIVNYRAGGGGRKAPNKQVVLGRYGKITPDQARRLAQTTLGKVASGDDPAHERAETRAMPTLADAFKDYIDANPNRSESTNKLYRYEAGRYLGDWLSRPLDAITRRDVEARFNRITADHGWSPANHAMSLLRSVYRRPCVDLDGLRNPVDLWLAAGGKFHRKTRRKISSPAEVLPCWRAGIEAEVQSRAMRDALWFGLYTGMRLREVLTLRWERVDMAALTFRVEETKTGVPLELPITLQLASILERRRTGREAVPVSVRDWVFPSPTSASGHVEDPHYLYPRITKTGGSKFWFHAFRNCFITVAERDLMLPSSLTKRLVNHARPNDVTEGYAADWTVTQLRDPAQNIADRIETLISAEPGGTAGQDAFPLGATGGAVSGGELKSAGRGAEHEARSSDGGSQPVVRRGRSTPRNRS